MACNRTDEELWDGIDQGLPEVLNHLSECSHCRRRADAFRSTIDAIKLASTPSTPPLPGKIGSYLISRRLGEGGMGIVYEGEQRTPRRLVAVKVVRGGRHVEGYRVKLFEREIQTLARLKHPSIASIYEAGMTEDGQHFFAMELVRGVHLNGYVRDRQVSRVERLEIFCKVCDAINYAHQRGVIHRDLKPSNILIDTNGNPKILDFSLARITDPDSGLAATGTELGQVRGTLPYMSPEVARGDPDQIDIRSDVYSLGVVFYELITGQLPYPVSRAVLHEAVRTICEEPPRRPSSLDRTLRGDLETIALKALEKERGRRYQSAAAFAEDIDRFLADQPILARRAGLFYRFRKLLIRRRAVFIVAVAMFLVVAASIFWVRATAHSFEAQQNRQQYLAELSVAILENKVAEEMHAQGKWDGAEPHYRRAMGIFRHLSPNEARRHASVKTGLALLILERETERRGGDPTRGDEEGEDSRWEELLEGGEDLLVEAVDFFIECVPPVPEDHRRALTALRDLYRLQAAVWDVAQELVEIEAELEELERADTLAEPPLRRPDRVIPGLAPNGSGG